MQSTEATIDAYFATLIGKKRVVLEKLRSLVETRFPASSGTMKHGMPYYEHCGHIVAFNAQKHYFAFYADPVIVDRYRTGLAGLDVGKSCIRFRKPDDMPEEIIRRIIADSTN